MTAVDQQISAYLNEGVGLWTDLVQFQAKARPDHAALIQEDRSMSYGELDALSDRIAASLQRDGVEVGESVAICALNSIEYAALYYGILKAGAVVAPLAGSASAESLRMMIEDCGARMIFVDAGGAAALGGEDHQLSIPVRRMDVDEGDSLASWLAPEGSTPAPVTVDRSQGFNIIYSSGTTGAPKGIVQSHKMRWAHCLPLDPPGFGQEAVTMLATPLYSNTTLVCFIPTLSGGGTVVLMPKFDTRRYLELASKHRATHTMLVPVQYQRLMDEPTFDNYDLSSFEKKFCTSAPFSAALKAEVLRRWPGGLIEYFGMTEGGGTCILHAHLYPTKLHTVGQPAPGHDIRILSEEGQQLPAGETGEIVGHSPSMMNGYHNLPGKTAETEWHSPDGKRFIRTGDIGRFDEEGFLTIMDRKKDVIISGGFNIFPSDLEPVIGEHEAVVDVAVVGVPSDKWGETPVAYVVLKTGATATPEDIKAYADDRLGKTQRVAAVKIIDELPRSAIGKILKRELRDRFVADAA